MASRALSTGTRNVGRYVLLSLFALAVLVIFSPAFWSR